MRQDTAQVSPTSTNAAVSAVPSCPLPRRCTGCPAGTYAAGAGCTTCRKCAPGYTSKDSAAK
jgi:hypothetical protein